MGRTRLAALALALVWPATVRAQVGGGEGARLRWVRLGSAETCVDQSALEREVVRRLRRDPFGGRAQTIEGSIAREGERWVARLFTQEDGSPERGERELTSDSEDCHALDAAIALAIALAIDPDAALAPPPDPEPPLERDPEPDPSPIEPPPDPEPRLADPSDPPPRPAEDDAIDVATPSTPLDARVMVGAYLAIDLVPGVAGGLALNTDARLFEILRWRAGVIFSPEVGSGGMDGSFSFGLTAAALDLCVEAFRVGPLIGEGCVGGAAGAIHAVVFDLVPAQPGDYAWGAVRATAELGVLIEERVYLALAIEGTVPLVRWAFRVVGRENPEFQQPYVVPGGRLSAGVQFW
ncbi:MAG: hypothetical protein AB7S26_17105 [Sandaracinaceae bacterium]